MSFPRPAAEYLSAITEHSAGMAEAAAEAGLAAPVPACPGWRVGTVIRHVGVLHRWVAAAVRDPAAARPDRAPFDPGSLPADWVSWFADGSAALVRALTESGTERAAWTLPGAGRSGFWFRRMAHETAIHRLDVEQAAARPRTGLPPLFAADGLDEFWTVQLDRKLRRSPVPELAGTLRWSAVDAGRAWTVRLDGGSATVIDNGPPRAGSTAGTAAGAVAGPAAELLLFAWNRAPLRSAAVHGDRRLLDGWPRLVRL